MKRKISLSLLMIAATITFSFFFSVSSAEASITQPVGNFKLNSRGDYKTIRSYVYEEYITAAGRVDYEIVDYSGPVEDLLVRATFEKIEILLVVKGRVFTFSGYYSPAKFYYVIDKIDGKQPTTKCYASIGEFTSTGLFLSINAERPIVQGWHGLRGIENMSKFRTRGAAAISLTQVN